MLHLHPFSGWCTPLYGKVSPSVRQAGYDHSGNEAVTNVHLAWPWDSGRCNGLNGVDQCTSLQVCWHIVDTYKWEDNFVTCSLACHTNVDQMEPKSEGSSLTEDDMILCLTVVLM